MNRGGMMNQGGRGMPV
jgi:polyadenylate-binding protein